MGFLSSILGKKSKSAKVKSMAKLSFLEVDMHNHLLPGIDDGSQSPEQSIQLIRGLRQLGFNKFICTPHILEGVHPNTPETIHRAHRHLQQALKEAHEKIDIVPAAEHMVDDGLQKLLNKGNLCVMPGDYVLIEMSYLQESKALFQTILDIQKLGYTPILAHPERYNYYHYNFDMYKQIKNAGCLLQINLLSISRYYGVEVKSTALTLLKSGMYDFVGTDLHHERHLAALQEVVAKYPIRDLLQNCNILNPTLADHMDNTDSSGQLGAG